MKDWYVYVGKEARGNFRIGLTKGIWGLKNLISTIPFQEIKPHDRIHFYFYISRPEDKYSIKVGGFPRNPNLTLFEGIFQEIHSGIVVSEYYQDHTPIWPNDIYPHRFKFQINDKKTNIVFDSDHFGIDIIKAVWDSAMRKGVPIPIGSSNIDIETFQVFNEYKQNIAKSFSTKELIQKVLNPKNKKKKKLSRQVTSIQYERDASLSELVKRMANGICQLCEQSSPFVNLSNEPYLETHHIIWLAKKGLDSLDNTIALCPNCHRKMHILNLNSDLEKLKNKARDIELKIQEEAKNL